MIMIFVSIIITAGTILSQVAIEYFVKNSVMESSQAALILLYSAVGSIVGNIGSMKIRSHRWEYFFAFMAIFAFLCALLPYTFINIAYTNLVAGVAGIFFGVSYNLMESYFFKKIGDDDKKPYGAVSLGIVTAVTIALLMFGVDAVKNIAGETWVYISLAVIIFCMGMITFLNKNKLT